METTINATQMKQGDVIRFYGAEFVIGEVYSRNVGTKDEVYWATGTTKTPSKAMLSVPSRYFPKNEAGEYTWGFQGNSFAHLTKVN